MLRKPPPFGEVEAKLAANGIKKNSPAWIEVYERWGQRREEVDKELKLYEKWSAEKKVKGKWPWQENGVDPRVRADKETTVGFRLKRVNAADGVIEYIPQVFNAKAKKFVSITGDIDLIAITKADGTPLSDFEHVRLLEAHGEGPARHPAPRVGDLGQEGPLLVQGQAQLPHQ